ncbi:uncharacterized protein LOC143251741 [Tachypleus tridentatus]|uniref:uncharacterized protein LOC143251741 n=1 Tax=Tachypleus tridentatus TaxID=6853 RepID=UPI003FCF7C3E
MSELTDLTKTGSLPQRGNKVLEKPQTDEHLSKNNDENFFYGVNSRGYCLLVKICRLQNKMMGVMAVVKTADDRSYSYADTPTKTVFRGESFEGGKLKCISTMRKWRISFNGLLKVFCKYAEKIRVIHVKFSFIWLAMSNVQDLSTDIDLTEAK